MREQRDDGGAGQATGILGWLGETSCPIKIGHSSVFLGLTSQGLVPTHRGSSLGK